MQKPCKLFRIKSWTACAIVRAAGALWVPGMPLVLRVLKGISVGLYGKSEQILQAHGLLTSALMHLQLQPQQPRRLLQASLRHHCPVCPRPHCLASPCPPCPLWAAALQRTPLRYRPCALTADIFLTVTPQRSCNVCGQHDVVSLMQGELKPEAAPNQIL